MRQRTRRVIARVDADGARRRAEARKADRYAALSAKDDDMVKDTLFLPTDKGMAIRDRVDRLARNAKGPDDQRTMDRRELAGYGPTTADLAREIAADATWHRLLTDPESGSLRDFGTTTYRPPAALRRHIQARDAPAPPLAAPNRHNAATSTTRSPTPKDPPPRATAD